MNADREPRDRRVQFFLIAGVLCFALYYPTPENLRWVPLALGSVYALLAALTALEAWSKRGSDGSSS